MAAALRHPGGVACPPHHALFFISLTTRDVLRRRGEASQLARVMGFSEPATRPSSLWLHTLRERSEGHFLRRRTRWWCNGLSWGRRKLRLLSKWRRPPQSGRSRQCGWSRCVVVTVETCRCLPVLAWTTRDIVLTAVDGCHPSARVRRELLPRKRRRAGCGGAGQGTRGEGASPALRRGAGDDDDGGQGWSLSVGRAWMASPCVNLTVSLSCPLASEGACEACAAQASERAGPGGLPGQARLG